MGHGGKYPHLVPSQLSNHPLTTPNLQPESKGAQMAWCVEVSLLKPREGQRKAEK